MRRWNLLLVFSIIVLVYSISTYSKVDHEIQDMFGSNEETKVLVLLKYNYSDDSEIKKIFNEDYDFQLTNIYSHANGFAGKLKKSSYEKLRKNPDVARIYKTKKITSFLNNSGRMVNATRVWSLIYNGTNVTGKGESVCLIDTGVDYTHPALGNCSNSSLNNGTCSKVISGYDFVNNDNDPLDDNGHGTHVAGIIASSNESFMGISPNASIVSIKVLDSSGEGDSSDLISGIDWCVNNATFFNISVIGMSLGTSTLFTTYCDDDDPLLTNSIANAIGKNISVIAATGNSGSTSGIASPACISNVTSVGAVNKNDNIIFNRNNITDLLAPGIGVISTKLGGGFESLSGTSMSAPHVAGAFALLHQYKRLEQNTTLSPAKIQNSLNFTGVRINDTSGSGFFFSRINILSTLLSLDNTPPNITLVFPTPINNSNLIGNSFIINITSNEILSNVILEFNQTNETINSTQIQLNWMINKTINSFGTFNYRIYGYDSAGNTKITPTFQISINNTSNNTNITLSILSVNLTNTDFLNRTNGTLKPFWSFQNLDGGSIIANETLWYINKTLAIKYVNKTFISKENTSKFENWTFSIRIYDGKNWSDFVNSSTISILNSKPSINITLQSLSILETQLVNISMNASDLDNDQLEFTSNKSEFIVSENAMLWYPNLTSSGNYVVNITVNDSVEIDSGIVNVTIMDARDLDKDGNPDFNDTDDDNDYIPDESDFLTGNLSSINSTLVLQMNINGTSNLSRLFNGTYLINFSNGSDEILEFYFTFNSSNTLDIGNLTINGTTSGYSAFSLKGNLNLFGVTKTIFLDKRNSTVKSVCIKDEDSSLENISSSCDSPNETLLICDNSTIGQYSCLDTGTRYKIAGLIHSAVKEQCRDEDGDGFGVGCSAGNDCDDKDYSKTLDCSSPSSGTSGGSGSSGGSGGGGGGGGGAGLTFVCNNEWECGDWSICEDELSSRKCKFVKVLQHAQDTQCSSLHAPPLIIQKCELPKSNPTKINLTRAETTESELSSHEEEKNSTHQMQEKNQTSHPTGFAIKNIINNKANIVISGVVLVAILILFTSVIVKKFTQKNHK